MKTTDSVMREFDKQFVVEMIDPTNPQRRGPDALVNVSIPKLKAFLSHSLAEARREWVEEMRGKANLIEVRSEARYLTDSGFWATKKLVAKDDVLDLLTGDNPESEGK